MNISVRDLHLSFGPKKVLQGMNLDVKSGEICVILGGSGSGKSVSLKAILGLVKPDSGSIKIDDKEITGLSEKALNPIRRRFGVIFQSGGLLTSLTVAQNVGLGLSELTKDSPAEIARTVDEQLDTVGLKGRGDQDPSTLSGGQRKRAAIARALTMHSDCLLLDEPTAGLDPPTATTVDNIIQRVNKEKGATCILVTHDLVSAMRLGTTLHLLHEGKILVCGTPKDFRESTNPVVEEFLAREFSKPETVSG